MFFRNNKVSLLAVISTLWSTGSFQEGVQLDFSFPDDVKLDFSFPDDFTLKDGDTFEYVVVGGGAAGSAAAARLALAHRARARSVLLLEAGGDPSPISHIPVLKFALLGGSLDWKYPSISNNVSCLSSIGKQCRFTRGKCLGGSTVINFMMFTRGNPRDFDDLHVPGWSWEELKPYFLRYEGFQNIERLPESSRPFHNTTGIMKIGFFDDPENPWQRRIISGFEQLKIPFNGDVNGVSQIGVTLVGGYVHEGLRMSTARAYLADTRVKDKLNVAKHTQCTGLIFDEDNRVTGLTVVQGKFNTTKRIYVKKEVVLSAGVIGTPQILMLSGIGSAEHLKEMGIPMRAELPVGDNMSDHVLPLMFICVEGGEEIADAFSVLTDQPESIAEFLVTRKGQFASNGLTDVSMFVNTRCFNRYNGLSNDTVCEMPSVQVIHSYFGRAFITNLKTFVKAALNFDDEVIDQLADKNAEFAFIAVNPIVLRPYSRGNVRLASRDPLELPAIYPNYLGDSRDLDEMMRSISIIEDLVETPVFKEHNASIFHIAFRECPSYESDRDGYWRCYARHMTYAVYHAVGTAALGAVVDERLRVRGVRGARVADLSVLPEIPRGNTEAIALAIGERVADLLLQEHADHTTPSALHTQHNTYDDADACL